MADRRSKQTSASVEDLEKLFKSQERKLARMRAMLDDFRQHDKTKVKLQYWHSSVEADAKLETFVRGLKKSE